MKFKVFKSNNVFDLLKSLVFFLVFLAAGILFIVLGSGVTNNTSNWISTDSQVTEINHQLQETYVTYYVESIQDTRTNKLNEYSSSWSKGTIIPILYNPSNVDEITSNTSSSKIIPIIGGSVFAAIGLIGTVTSCMQFSKSKKSSKENEKETTSEPGMFLPGKGYVYEPDTPVDNEVKVEPLISSKEELVSLYFRPTNNRRAERNKFVLEDENKKIIFESKLQDHNIFKGKLISFTDYLKGTSNLHRISYGLTNIGKPRPNAFSGYYFKIDKKNLWDYLDENNVIIRLNYREDGAASCSVLRNEKEIATIDSDLEKTKIYKAFGKTYGVLSAPFYNIKCKKEDIEIAFFAAFTINYLTVSNSHR